MSYTTERRKEIGAEQGPIYRQRALDKYYANPNVCKNCGKIIDVPRGKKPGDIRTKKFCNHSCAARFNNSGVDRWETARGFKQRTRQTIDGSTKISKCESCGKDIVIEPKKRPNGQKGYYYYDRRYCDQCLKVERVKATKQSCREKALKSGKTHTISANKETLPELIVNGITKGELKELTKDFGYYGWKAQITRHARRTYAASKQEMKCKICGFDFHVHVAHIKDVSEFTDDDKVSEINDLSNLVALCPNHHIMFDRKAIKI